MGKLLSRFFLYFRLFKIVYNKQMFDINFANDWIWTADLWCWNWPLYRLSHNHCPWKNIFKRAPNRWQKNGHVIFCKEGTFLILRLILCRNSVTRKNRQMSIKVQKSPNLVTLCPIRNATGTTCGHLIIKGLNFRPFPKKFTKYFEPFPDSFFFIFVFSIQFIVNKIANDGIWTVDLWFR